MTSISKELEKEHDFFSGELNVSSKSLINDIALYLFLNKDFYNLFLEVNFNFSFFCANLTVGKEKK